MRLIFRACWQAIHRHPVWSIIVLVFVLLVAFAIFVYFLGWDWTGFNGGFSQTTTTNTSHGITIATVQPPEKTLWDFLQLLIIPVVLAVAAFLFNLATTHAEQQIAAQRYTQDRQIAAQRYEQDQKIALEKQREDLLQIYLDRMSELLLKEELGSSTAKPEVRNVARVRTITILFQLDARRIGTVFGFLREAGLMSTKSNSSIVSLSQADLSYINLSQTSAYEAVFSEADLYGANFSGADLRRANLSGAILIEANLDSADLDSANLSRANLSRANLSGANLSRANLSGAAITNEQLAKAKSLQGATMPDGTIHP